MKVIDNFKGIGENLSDRAIDTASGSLKILYVPAFALFFLGNLIWLLGFYNNFTEPMKAYHLYVAYPFALHSVLVTIQNIWRKLCKASKLNALKKDGVIYAFVGSFMLSLQYVQYIFFQREIPASIIIPVMAFLFAVICMNFKWNIFLMMWNLLAFWLIYRGLGKKIILRPNIIPDYIKLVFGCYIIIMICIITNLLYYVRHNIKADSDALSESQKLNTQMVLNLGQNLRNPINVITGMVQSILRRDRNPAVRDYAYNVRDSVYNLKSAVNDLMDQIGIELGAIGVKRDDINIKKLISDCAVKARLECEAFGKGFNIYCSSDLPSRLLLDELRTRLAITNLINYTRRHTTVGTVTLGFFSNKNPDDETVNLVVNISNDTEGVEKEDADNIRSILKSGGNLRAKDIEGCVEIFHAVKLAESLGGRVYFDSIPDKGMTFGVEINAVEIDGTPVGEVESFINDSHKRVEYTDSFKAEGKKLLLVDNEKLDFCIIEELLSKTGMIPEYARDKEECLAKVKENKYDIIMIGNFPPELDGIETFKELKTLGGKNANVPVIALSESHLVRSRHKYLDAGFNDYISKPIDDIMFFGLLASYLSKDQAAAAGN
ncbi:MAG: hybrid sensor histidine kinase/response regulator [Lachnospiraceae bacterium]|nr:hybrid sensor histidine kinase/response regulator [Lachnospiraceae bacterium]